MPKFYEVDIIDGELDIDYKKLEQGIQVSNDKAVVKVKDDIKVKDSFVEITQEAFESNIVPIIEPIPTSPDITSILVRIDKVLTDLNTIKTELNNIKI